jgi:hypothetical protein
VDSGRGWHVYWPLTEPVEVTKWLPVAQTFKARCTQANIIIDPDVPADVARVLRVPSTKNFKDSPPQDVVLMNLCEPMLFEDFTALMGPLVPTKPVYAPKQLDEFTRAMLGNRQSRFRTIFDKTLAGTGCEQLRYLMENQADIEEPLWRAGLSIAKHCVDGDKAIHIISEANPSPNIFTAYFTPRSGRAELTTRVRLADSQRVWAIAQMSDGSYWQGYADTLVTLSACTEMI